MRREVIFRYEGRFDESIEEVSPHEGFSLASRDAKIGVRSVAGKRGVLPRPPAASLSLRRLAYLAALYHDRASVEARALVFSGAFNSRYDILAHSHASFFPLATFLNPYGLIRFRSANNRGDS